MREKLIVRVSRVQFLFPFRSSLKKLSWVHGFLILNSIARQVHEAATGKFRSQQLQKTSHLSGGVRVADAPGNLNPSLDDGACFLAAACLSQCLPHLKVGGHILGVLVDHLAELNKPSVEIPLVHEYLRQGVPQEMVPRLGGQKLFELLSCWQFRWLCKTLAASREASAKSMQNPAARARFFKRGDLAKLFRL